MTLLSIALLCCLFGPVASAGAAPPDFSEQALLARLALQQAQLTAGDGAAGDLFGSAVALSGDTALVGAQYHSTAGKADAGAAYVFVRTGGVWTQQQMLSAADGAAGDEFGSAVALSGDTALVGAQYHSTAGKAEAGAAYVFVRSGDVWTQQQMLSAGDGAAGDEFGSAVALSGDTALVGAPGHHAAGKEWAGAAYVFLLNPAPHPKPKIAKVTPASGKRGALVTITGSGFGARGSTSVVKFGSKTCTKYVSWSAAQIKCKVPMTAKYGTVKVTVTTSAGKSNALTFTVKR